MDSTAENNKNNTPKKEYTPPVKRQDLDRYDTGYTSHDEVPEWVKKNSDTSFGEGANVDPEKKFTVKKFHNIDEEMLEEGAKTAGKATDDAELKQGMQSAADITEATLGIITSVGTQNDAMDMWKKHVEGLSAGHDGGASVNETLDRAIGGTVNTSTTFDNVATANFLQETGVSMSYDDKEDGLETYTSFQNAYQYKGGEGSSLYDEIINAPEGSTVKLYDTELRKHVAVRVDDTFVSGGKSGISESDKVTLRQYAESQFAKEGKAAGGVPGAAQDQAAVRKAFNEEAQRDFFGGLTIRELIYDNPDKPTFKKEVYHGARISTDISGLKIDPRLIRNKSYAKKGAGVVEVKINGRKENIRVNSDNIIKRYEERDITNNRTRIRATTLTSEAYNYTMRGTNRLDRISRSLKAENALYAQYLTQALSADKADRFVKQLSSGKRMSESEIKNHLRRSGVKAEVLNSKETKQIIKAMSESANVAFAVKNAKRSTKRTTGVYRKAASSIVQGSELVEGAKRVASTYRIASKVTRAAASAGWNSVFMAAEGATVVAGGVVRMTRNPQMSDLVERADRMKENIEKIRTAPRDLKKKREEELLKRKAARRAEHHIKAEKMLEPIKKINLMRREVMKRSAIGRIQLTIEDTAAGIAKAVYQKTTQFVGAVSKVFARIKFYAMAALAIFFGVVIVYTIATAIVASISTPASYLNAASLREGDAEYFATAAEETASELLDYAKTEKNNAIFGTNGVINKVLATCQSEYNDSWEWLRANYPYAEHDVWDNGYLDSASVPRWSVLNYGAGNTDCIHYVSVTGDDLSTMYTPEVNPTGINQYENEAGDYVYTEGLQFQIPTTGDDGETHYLLQYTQASFRYCEGSRVGHAFNVFEAQQVPTQYLNAKQIMCAADYVLSQDLTNLYTPAQCLQFCKYIYANTHHTNYQMKTTWHTYYYFEGIRWRRVRGEWETYTYRYTQTDNSTPEQSGDYIYKVVRSLEDVAINVYFVMAPSICSEFEPGKDKVSTIYGPILVAQNSAVNQSQENPVNFRERDALERYELTLYNEWDSSFDVEGYDTYGFPRDADGHLISDKVTYIEDRLSHDIAAISDGGYDFTGGGAYAGGSAGEFLPNNGADRTDRFERLSVSEQTNIYKTVLREYGGKVTNKVKKVLKRSLQEVGDTYDQPSRMNVGVYDCSSLAARMYAEAGFTDFIVDNWAMTAAGEAELLASRGQYTRQALQVDQLKPGDLIFYSTDVNGRFDNITHVAVYMGAVDGVPKVVEALGVNYGVVYGNLRPNNIVGFGHVDTRM